MNITSKSYASVYDHSSTKTELDLTEGCITWHVVTVMRKLFLQAVT